MFEDAVAIFVQKEGSVIRKICFEKLRKAFNHIKALKFV